MTIMPIIASLFRKNFLTFFLNMLEACDLSSFIFLPPFLSAAQPYARIEQRRQYVNEEACGQDRGSDHQRRHHNDRIVSGNDGVGDYGTDAGPVINRFDYHGTADQHRQTEAQDHQYRTQSVAESVLQSAF